MGTIWIKDTMEKIWKTYTEGEYEILVMIKESDIEVLCNTPGAGLLDYTLDMKTPDRARKFFNSFTRVHANKWLYDYFQPIEITKSM